jgi:hypothetical protein
MDKKNIRSTNNPIYFIELEINISIKLKKK